MEEAAKTEKEIIDLELVEEFFGKNEQALNEDIEDVSDEESEDLFKKAKKKD